MIRRILRARETALFGILVALFIGFSLTDDAFLDWFSIFERTRHWVVPGMLAIPMTFIIATAGIDLSVGAIVALCSVVFGLLFQNAGWPVPAAAAAAILTGLAAGAFNGGVSSFLNIPPLVVTLATMTLFRGLAFGLSEASNISNFPANFLWISQGDLFEFPAGEAGPVFFPVPLLALIVVVVLGHVLLRHAWVGRYTECVGENPTAARFAAVPVNKLLFALYAASGLVAGIAALFFTAQYGTAKADAGTGLELEAIACVVIGGTRISGGQASVLGSLLGLLIIGMLRYGLELAGMPMQYIVIVVGFLLIATAVLNEWMARRGGAKS